MKRYYKYVYGNHIAGIGIGPGGGIEITEKEYKDILSVIRAKPDRTDTIDYKLREDMTWEAYTIDPSPKDGEVDDGFAILV